MRRPMPAARVPAHEQVRRPPDPQPAQRGLRPSRAMALDRREPRAPGRTTAGPAGRPAAADAGAGGRHRERGVVRSGVGHARLAGDDHRRPPRRALRAALEQRRLRLVSHRDQHQHRASSANECGRRTRSPTSAAASSSTRKRSPYFAPTSPPARTMPRSSASNCARTASSSPRPRSQHVLEAGHRDTAVQPYVHPARLGHAHPPAAALLHHRTDRRRRRHPHRGRPARPRRRRNNDTPGVQRVGCRGGPTSVRRPRRRLAELSGSTAPPARHSRYRPRRREKPHPTNSSRTTCAVPSDLERFVRASLSRRSRISLSDTASPSLPGSGRSHSYVRTA